MEFRNIKFFLAVGVLFAQNAFAVDPPAIGPALPPGYVEPAIAQPRFDPQQQISQINAAEASAQRTLASAQALEAQYQGYVSQGTIDSVPASVVQARAQAETSLKTIQQTKAAALKSYDQYQQFDTYQKPSYQDAIKQTEANLQKLADEQSLNPTTAGRDEALRQFEGYQRLKAAGEDAYNEAVDRQLADGKARAQQDLESLTKSASNNLAIADGVLKTAETKGEEALSDADKKRAQAEIDARKKFNDSLMPGVGIAAPLGAPKNREVTDLRTQSDRRVNDVVLRWGVCRLYTSVEGGMGALFATIAGVIAVIFAVVGAFKAAWGFMLVAVGAFILRSLVSLFYGGDFNVCNEAAHIDGINNNVENPSDFSDIG